MTEGVPLILVVLLAILVIGVIFGYLAWRRYKDSGLSLFSEMNKKAFLIQLSTGIILSLFAAFLMFNGELFGENTTGIARIIGIVSIMLIATTTPMARALKRKPVSE